MELLKFDELNVTTGFSDKQFEKIQHWFHEFKDLIIINNQKQITIMGALEDLQAESAGLKTDIADLQTTVDTEQAQIQALLDTNAGVVTTLNEKIADLEAQVAAGVSPEALSGVIADLKSTRDSIATTKADIASTVPDAPPAETPPA